MDRTLTKLALLSIALLLLGGCGQHYVTPGGGVSMALIADEDLLSIEDRTDYDFRKFYETLPASYFPSSIAVVRVQDTGYRSSRHRGYGQGRFTIVTTRDIENDTAFADMSRLNGIAGVSPIGRMLVPTTANTIRDLRVPAARLHADMILVYSVDTSFTIGGRPVGPLSVISLGTLRNLQAKVTATVSGMLVDVRTGFIYGTAEATDHKEQATNIWSTRVTIEKARQEAESAAFVGFVDEFSAMWSGVVSTHGNSLAARPRLPDSGYYSVEFED